METCFNETSSLVFGMTRASLPVIALNNFLETALLQRRLPFKYIKSVGRMTHSSLLCLVTQTGFSLYLS